MEYVAHYFGFVGSPVVGTVILCGSDAWQLKVIAIVALLGLLFSSYRGLRREDTRPRILRWQRRRLEEDG